MITLFIWSIVAYGICNILIFGSNFEWWRNFLKQFGTGGYSIYKLFTCFMCLPTWVGFSMSALFQLYLNILTPSILYGVNNIWLSILIDGVFTSGIVWLIHSGQELLERLGNKG